MNQNITIIVDYLGFLRRNKYQSSTLDIDIISSILVRSGYKVSINSFQDIAERVFVPRDSFIWYTSSEFPSYKTYIEDILFSLNSSNILVPSFDFLRAHNNKGFQEFVRQKYDITSLNSHYFGTLEELLYIIDKIEFPVVLKGIEGSGSKNVELCQDKYQLINRVKKFSRQKRYFVSFAKKMLKRYLFVNKYEYENSMESLNYKNFILQKFIPDLKNDWKVLVFYDKYFVLKRIVKRNDFRASGSGYYFWEEVEFPLLDFCSGIRGKFNVPWISLDICFFENEYHLIEFQCVHFGPIALNNSSFYYEQKADNHWEKIEAKSNLSASYSEAFIKYIHANYS